MTNVIEQERGTIFANDPTAPAPKVRARRKPDPERPDAWPSRVTDPMPEDAIAAKVATDPRYWRSMRDRLIEQLRQSSCEPSADPSVRMAVDAHNLADWDELLAKAAAEETLALGPDFVDAEDQLAFAEQRLRDSRLRVDEIRQRSQRIEKLKSEIAKLKGTLAGMATKEVFGGRAQAWQQKYIDAEVGCLTTDGIADPRHHQQQLERLQAAAACSLAAELQTLVGVGIEKRLAEAEQQLAELTKSAAPKMKSK